MAGLADVLLEQGVVTPEQLQRAEEHANQQGSSMAKALVDLGLSTEETLVQALATSIGMEYADVGPGAVDRDAARLLPKARARELGALPVQFGTDDKVVVAVPEPKPHEVVAELESAIGLPVRLALAPRRLLLQAIEANAVDVVPDKGRTNGGGPGAAGPNLRAVDGGVPAVPTTPPPAPSTHAAVLHEEAVSVDLDELLGALVGRGGSDLHLTTGLPPTIRVDGDLTALDEYPEFEPDELQKLLYSIMTQKQREKFENELELDMSYSVPGRGRFRVNIFRQRDAIGAVMRAIPFEIKPLEDLGIPSQVANFAYLPRGFVLVTGPTGSGKSTTLASLIDLINRNRPVHIMTVEDPIEFLHQHKRAVVNQREVGTDTKGFATALKHVLRQDPDVILVGEMRDLETIQIALTAAETGHLVFGTLHTQDAPQTVDRVIDVFPPHQQEQIRVMLAGALKGVVCQTLLKTADGGGRTVATEIMVSTSGIKNLIREGKTHQIYSSIQAGAKDGMVSMDQSLAALVKGGKVSYDTALEKCNNPNEFNRLVGRA